MEKAALRMSYKDWEKKYRLQLVGYNALQLYIDLVNFRPKSKRTKKKK